MGAEQRIHPRISVELPAELTLNGVESVSVQLCNISMGGAMVQGDERLSALLHDHPLYRQGLPVELDLHFGLDTKPLHFHCRLVHLGRLSQFSYRVGLKFLSLPQEHHNDFQSFIRVNMS